MTFGRGHPWLARVCAQGNEVVMVHGSNFGPLGSTVFAQYSTVEGVWSVIDATEGAVGDTQLPPVNFTAATCQVRAFV